MFENSDDFLTVDETCELLKMGHNAVYRLLNSGTLKALRNGRVWRVQTRNPYAYGIVYRYNPILDDGHLITQVQNRGSLPHYWWERKGFG